MTAAESYWKARADAAEARADAAERKHAELLDRWVTAVRLRDALQAKVDAALAILEDFEDSAGTKFLIDYLRAALTDPPKAEPEGEACPAVLNLLGEHFPCDWDNGKPHPGWGHANKQAHAVWCGDEGPVRPKAEPETGEQP